MTQLVSVVVLAVVLLVLFRLFAAESDDEAEATPLDPLPVPVPPPPTRPGPALRPRPGETPTRDAASPTTPGAPPWPAPRRGRTRLFGLGGVGADGAFGGTRHTGGYAVLGYRTTGFTPVRDRLVAIAVLHVDARGTVEGRHDGYLSPGVAPIPPHLVGMTDRIHEAPSFARAAPHLLALLEGRVVVAHDVEFLEAFLDAHLMEAGVLAPSIPALCTRQLGLTTFPTRNHRLSTLARAVGSAVVVGRSAVDDAYAVAAVLPAILRAHGERLTYPCEAAGDPRRIVLPAGRVPAPGGDAPDPWLADLFARTSGLARELNDVRVARFVDVLVPLLLQGRLVPEEVRGLTRLMVAAGYGAAELRQIQERLLELLRRAAFEHERIGARGVSRLRTTAASVGIPGYFDDLVPPEPPPAPEPGSGSFSRPVRKPLPPAPMPHLPRCGHCLEIGHYTSACPRRERGPVRAISPI
ncbi:DNA polymerase III subunit epsilon [Mobilicoccus pelagius]|uniref:Exonuclease domain-containing protein n=1 Tax=Mobilicoccus pelagius NBRC 104925 TaxID=1089455 RepID=H5UQS9_9MICO|nr:DNA polymerase III subunit epsilon [Mobilicoccus pelagius]GAB48087.1 hypothetical protein MOPEL_060_00030 [Mobilicoccus pelagius NBRC 104925]